MNPRTVRLYPAYRVPTEHQLDLLLVVAQQQPQGSSYVLLLVAHRRYPPPTSLYGVRLPSRRLRASMYRAVVRPSLTRGRPGGAGQAWGEGWGAARRGSPRRRSLAVCGGRGRAGQSEARRSGHRALKAEVRNFIISYADAVSALHVACVTRDFIAGDDATFDPANF